MPFRESSLPLRDVVASIDAIESFTEGMDFEAFRADAKTIAAVERKLQVISEAAVRLGEDAELALCASPVTQVARFPLADGPLTGYILSCAT